MTPRQYTEDDEARVAALWRACFPDYTGYNAPEAVLRAKRLVDDHIYVIEDDGEIIATCMAGYDGHRGWLYSVAVADSRQGEGLGKRMVEFVVERLRERGCVKVNLQIRGGNEEVADFYRRLGFDTEDRISMGLILDP